MGINFLGRLNSVNKVGYGMTTTAQGALSGLTNWDYNYSSPQSGTNWLEIGPGTATFTVSGGGGPVPASYQFMPVWNRVIKDNSSVDPITQQIIMVGGGGRGGHCSDYGSSGGGGGGGVVYDPAAPLTSGTFTCHAGGTADPSYVYPGHPAYMVAIRGGRGGDRGENDAPPGGCGGGRWQHGTSGHGVGYQQTYPNPFGTPQRSAQYGHGNTAPDWASGGNAPLSWPDGMIGNGPLAPRGSSGFGRGQGIGGNHTPPNGSGCGGSGSHPGGTSGNGNGAPGCVIIRVS